LYNPSQKNYIAKANSSEDEKNKEEEASAEANYVEDNWAFKIMMFLLT